MSLLNSACRPLASSSRLFSTSVMVAAAKKPAKPAAKKRQGSNFGKPKGENKAAGGSKIKAGGLALKSAIGRPLPDLGDLPQLYPETANAMHVGKPTLVPRKTYEQLQVFGLPRSLANEQTPMTVLRASSLSLISALRTTPRVLLTGARGTGKSHAMLHALSHALASDSIVVALPSAVPLIDSSSPFAYNARTQRFDQPQLAAQLLERIAKVNGGHLAKVQVSDGQYAGQTLGDVAAAGARDEKASVEALEAVFDGLAKQTQFQVLLAIDNAQALFQTSEYRAPDYTPLESYHLSVPALLLDFVSGRKSFERGSTLLSLTMSDPPRLPTASLLQPLGLPSATPIHAYTPINPVHAGNAKGLQPFEIGAMDGREARGLFEIWSRLGWARSASDETFLSALSTSAGNPLELGRGWRETLQAF